jgi:glutaredoxin 3
MNIAVYTKTGCPSCVKAKNLLSNREMSYDEVEIGKDIAREEFMSLFPGVMTAPFIIIDGVKVGGYEQLERYINEHKQG